MPHAGEGVMLEDPVAIEVGVAVRSMTTGERESATDSVLSLPVVYGFTTFLLLPSLSFLK
jgi:hypothetical protein